MCLRDEKSDKASRYHMTIDYTGTSEDWGICNIFNELLSGKDQKAFHFNCGKTGDSYPFCILSGADSFEDEFKTAVFNNKKFPLPWFSCSIPFNLPFFVTTSWPLASSVKSTFGTWLHSSLLFPSPLTLSQFYTTVFSCPQSWESVLFFFFNETESCYVVQTDLKFSKLLRLASN